MKYKVVCLGVVILIFYCFFKLYKSIDNGLKNRDTISFNQEMASSLLFLQNLALYIKRGDSFEQVKKVLQQNFANEIIKYPQKDIIEINIFKLLFREDKLYKIEYFNNHILLSK